MEVVRFRHNNDGNLRHGGHRPHRHQQAFPRSSSSCCRSATSRTSPRWWIFHTYVKTDLHDRNLVWLGNEALNIGTENIHFATLPVTARLLQQAVGLCASMAQATCDLTNEALNPYK